MSIPYQHFTEKVIAALAAFKVLRRDLADEGRDQVEFEDDEMEVRWIEENTHPKLMISIYILDRCINPSKGEFRVAKQSVTFDSNTPSEDDPLTLKQVTLTENQMQFFLCSAMRRVNDIIMKNIKAYNDEIPIPNLGDSNEKKELSFDSI